MARVALLLVGLLSCGGERPAEVVVVEGPCRGPACFESGDTPRAEPALVLFVVMDTLRSASSSLCGYERPTTPFLAALAEQGAAWSCAGEAPSSWTIPSHASFFTGLPVYEHGVYRESGSVRHLEESRETLAELFRDRGYRTVCISANSFVSETVGLTQGCEVIRPGQRNLRGEEVLEFLESSLGEAGDPVFVFLNLYEAHDPWQEIPKGVGWVRKRDLPENDFAQRWAFVRGELEDRQAAAYLSHTRDLYDYGVFLADRALEKAFLLLQERGFLQQGFRLVVTSDHGEFLGEHGLLNHGKTLYEPVTRVPVLSWEWPAPDQPSLPQEPFSATAVHGLVLDGEYREEEALAVDMPDPYWARHSHERWGMQRYLATWEGEEKVLVSSEGVQGFDLRLDPGEARPTALQRELPEVLRAAIGALEAKRETLELRPEALEMLRSLGYAE